MMAVYKARREASEETNLADTLILDFQPPGPGRKCCLLLKLPSLWSLLSQPEQSDTSLTHHWPPWTRGMC